MGSRHGLGSPAVQPGSLRLFPGSLVGSVGMPCSSRSLTEFGRPTAAFPVVGTLHQPESTFKHGFSGCAKYVYKDVFETPLYRYCPAQERPQERPDYHQPCPHLFALDLPRSLHVPQAKAYNKLVLSQTRENDKPPPVKSWGEASS